jgi:predicted ribonuclease YlaK
MKLPVFLKQGEAARLFPILADTSKEGRATSILLSCMAKVDEFALSQIKTLGIRTGKRTKLECFTEVVFADSAYKNKRPDGLLVVNTGAHKK